MKIITWNINGLQAAVRKGLLSFIEKEAADAYCFQEVKARDYALLDGYKTYGVAAKKPGYSGVLIYTKVVPKSVIRGVGNEEIDREGRVIALEFEDFFLVNAYFPHSNRELKRLDFKLKFNKAFEDFCKGLGEKKPLIITGDFNVAHKEIDLRNPKTNKKNAGFTQQEREWFDSFLRIGYVDAFREFTSAGDHYTWWPYRNNARERNIGWRIDTFVASEGLKNSLKDCKIMKNITGSDHCPVLLELK